METFFFVVKKIIQFCFIVYFTVFFFLSLKKCFLKDKSKVKLFVLSLITGPFLSYIEACCLSSCIVRVINPEMFFNINNKRASAEKYIFILCLIIAVAFLLINLLYAWLLGKWLETGTRSSVVYLYLMFNTLAIMLQTPTGTGMMFSVPYLRDIVDIAGNLSLLLAAWLFYRHDIRMFSKIARTDIKVDWRLFNIPPAVFILLYTFYVAELGIAIDPEGVYPVGDDLVLAIYIFSTIIMYLFIWAFYVIIKNLSATNEAIKATNEAIKAKDEVKTLSVEVMEALAHTIDAKDEYTRGHSVRVAKYSRMMAERLGLSPEECENVYYMALLHDIGKIGVPNEIINSKDKLTDEEYTVIKTHPGLGYDILAEIKSRPDLSIGARWHHERFDGKGYPDGKKGDEIPFYARIIAVADSYDAMTSNRSYRDYLPQEKVRSEIKNNMGTQFDPDVARCMLAIIDEDKEYELHE